MHKNTPVSLLKLVLRLGLATVLFTASAAAQQRQGSLELRKTKHMVDENGRVFLSVQLVNQGARAVNVAGIAPTRWGPWTNMGQKVEPGATVRGAIKITKDEPSAVWVDSSEGLSVFKLPARQ